MSTIVLLVVGLGFLGMGLLGLVAPQALIRPFAIELSAAEARSEVRAVYGGFGVAIAVLLALAAADIGELRRGATLAVAFALAGMAVGRLVGLLVELPRRFYPIGFYTVVEVTVATLLVLVVK